MIAFLFSDLHASEKTLKKVFGFVADPKNKIDLMLFAGDFVNMGEPLDYQEKFIQLHTLHPLPFFWVPGNNDFGRSYNLMMKYLPSVEGRVENYKGLKITGVGGSPASWSGEYQGETGIASPDLADSIFLSHQPPPISNLTKFDMGNNKSEIRNPKQYQKSNNKNSKQISKFEIRNSDLQRRIKDSPLIHICGHVHREWGIGYIGNTKVVKLAASYLGFAATMDTESLEVKFIEL
jgi:Icc-related predicted phosphoesterase